MLHRVRMKSVEQKPNTTQCKPCDTDAPAPMDSFYPDTGALSSLPFDTAEFMLWISDYPFADGEVDLALPPLPFVRSTKNKTRFEIQNARGRRLRSSLEYPVTQAFMNNHAVTEEVINEQRPIYFGISVVPETVIEDEKPAASGGIAVGDEIDRADALAALDTFLRERVRVKRGGRLTSRQIWAMWAKYHNADPADDIIHGVRLTDVARRFRAVFGATAVKTPTRIDGISQRYWVGYTV